MNITDFIKKIAETLDVDNNDELTPYTYFREIDEWSSLAHLSVIVMMDECFGIQIDEAEFGKLKTIEDLYNACIKK